MQARFFVDAYLRNLFGLTTFEPSLDISLHDSLDGIPVQPKKGYCLLNAAACLKYTNGKCLKHQCESRVLACPGDIHRFYPTLLTRTSGRSCLKDGFKLHRIEVAPRPLWSQISSPAGGTAFGAGQRSSAMFQCNDNSLRLHRKIHRFYKPSFKQAQQHAMMVV